MLTAELHQSLDLLARTPLLLVASDFDGTLAGIARAPALAAADPRALSSLRELSRVPWTTTSVVSGRSLADLRSRVGDGGGEVLIGSHGAELPPANPPLTPDQSRLLAWLENSLRPIASSAAGTFVEVKPTAVALHTREVEPALGKAVVESALTACASVAGVHVRFGAEVVEFSVAASNKGDAVRHLRDRTGATGILFVGDDATDEDAFAALAPADVGIKVGGGHSSARHRISGVAEVAEVFGVMAALRREWVAGRRLTRLERCSLLSDQRTIAVVSPDACVSWLCLPRLDSSAMFAGLIGGEDAGTFSVSPAMESGSSHARYDPSSFVLVTQWPNLRVTDYLDCSGGRAYQRAGRADLIRVIEGDAPARIRFAPRLDFGRVATRLRQADGGLVVEGSHDPVCLRSVGIAWSITPEGLHSTATASIDPSRGPIVLELRYGTASLRPHIEEEPARREANRRFWSGWAGALSLPSVEPDLVRRSALTLKALCYGPAGSIAGAATTSLPEQVGGVRNWDYRYCWPRDAAIAAAALVRLGNTGHALKLLDWMLEVVDRCESPDRLHPVYTVTGGHLPPEAELGHLAGYGQSRPVRIGNAAASQMQLDVFGPIVNLVAMLAERGAPIGPDHWRLVRAMVRAVESRWQEADHGIWEMRTERRHHVHSKVMCWHTVDRALVVEDVVNGTKNPDWLCLRDTIRADVLAHGWSDRCGTLVGAYGHDYTDAGVLVAGLCGLLAPDDPRWESTVDCVLRDLRDDGTVRRYVTDDGIPGTEGGMHLCTGWLVEALIMVGRVEEARVLFQCLTNCAGVTGVMTEQFDPTHSAAVGNFAQAYSHAAVINAAVALDRVCVRSGGNQ